MAKFVFTVEDRQGGVTLSLDMREGPASPYDRSTRASRLAKRLLDIVEMEDAINTTPAHKLLPPSQTLH
ncbi:hypothetical protein NNO07_11080 [Pseudomonas resinovorans]|uniref:Uncharacterized protein n=1 Tax=Metapseudomonas resinovorans TaxID=53412 RepID=A0ABT4Y429_METRE|nr:hypothetical protein [Pseudomonas resinovorans]MDA8483615.1 hypothetical protein [Pseudomonas resinovorans]